MFETERDILQRILSPWLTGPIEHIGSTAVPGLIAKPVIDIMAPVESLAASRDAIPAAAKAGYVYFPYRPKEFHWLCKPSDAFRTHHLHLVPFGTPLWYERLTFRDVLRRSPIVAAEYADLKRSLAAKYEFDRERYTDEKGPFIERAIKTVDV
jgi:GrpB-like predicted nucleotidyltransferase (UPF0157 family)